jgi:hypothetical protein
MKMLHVTIGTNVMRFTEASLFGALIAALAGAETYEKDWNGDLTAKPQPIGMEFVDPDMTTDNPAVAAMKKEMEQYRRWWSDGNEEARKLKAEIAELQKQTAGMGGGKTTLDLRG